MRTVKAALSFKLGLMSILIEGSEKAHTIPWGHLVCADGSPFVPNPFTYVGGVRRAHSPEEVQKVVEFLKEKGITHLYPQIARPAGLTYEVAKELKAALPKLHLVWRWELKAAAKVAPTPPAHWYRRT